MPPDTGGRFSLRLADHGPTQARYGLTLSIADAEWSSEAVVAVDDGRVDFGAWQGVGEPPAWLLQYARAALRTTWRGHAEQGWPRRLTRWRDAPVRAEQGVAKEGREGQGRVTEQGNLGGSDD